jgi:small neutral amino acid transporter SnatA (MarC family)
MSTVFVASLGALLPVTNPIFILAVYAGMTESFPQREVRRQAVLVGIYSFLVLAAFAVLGTLILHTFGITLYALQIAGGLVVAYAGFGMLSQRAGVTSVAPAAPDGGSTLDRSAPASTSPCVRWLCRSSPGPVPSAS